MKDKARGFMGIQISAILAGICLAVVCLIFSFRAEAEEERVVRVGFQRQDGYHTVDGNGYRSGYDYEYLMEIAKYTGWNYEFVEGTWQECREWLEEGSIDLLGGVTKEQGCSERIFFADIPALYVSGCLFTEAEQNTYAYEEFEAFDGMRIGTILGFSLTDPLRSYSEENHFSYKLRFYASEKKLQEALEKGQIDCIYLNDRWKLGEYKMIANFGYTPLYYAAGSQELKQELDNALEQIHIRNHNYEGMLSERYLSADMETAFSRAEETYIQEQGQITIVLADQFPLICEYNKLKNEYQGVVIDALELLAKRTGLSFEYEELPKDVLPGIYLEEHPNQVMAPFLKNGLISYGDMIQTLNTIVPGNMAMVKKMSRGIEPDEPFTMAIPENMYGADEHICKLFPNAGIKFCRSHKEGLNMVAEGKADITLVNEVSAAYLLQSPYYKDLRVVNTDKIAEDITLAVSNHSDPELIAILNKGIARLGDQEIRQIVTDNTVARIYKMNLSEWIHENKAELILCAVTIAGLLSFFTAKRIQKKKRLEEEQEERIREERRKADLEYQRRIFYQANFDALTGLYNKERFMEISGALLRENPNIVYAFFRLNLEKFKVINEVYGYKTGDEILRKIADKLRENIGKEGVYGRIYSDHFVICYPIGADELQKRTRNSLLFLNCNGQEIRVQLNIGVYVNYGHYEDVSQLMDYAQIALQNKEKSENIHYCYYKDEYLNHMIRIQKITSEMENALQERQFQIFFQPQFELGTNKLVGAEALIRWFHPVEGQIYPNEFIYILEENGFIYRLDSYVCDCVCRQMKEWAKRGKLIPVSINLSRVDLQNPKLISMLQGTLEKYGIPVSYLHLEITESAYVENQKQMIAVIEKLRAAGFCIEMDDFGSGYSSLNMLKDIPVDALKLDMQFFSGETHMDRGGNIIETIVNLAHELGILVIAEGVETLREANFLLLIQCLVVQGYLYGKPMPIEKFEELLERKETGEKILKPEKNKGISALYWKIEKYNALLRQDGALLFDYDPADDCAVFAWMEPGGELTEKMMPQFTKHLSMIPGVHPEDQEIMKKVLQSSAVEGEVQDFRSNYFGTGEYEWMHIETDNYFSGGKVNRVIAVIRKKGFCEKGAQK